MATSNIASTKMNSGVQTRPFYFQFPSSLANAILKRYFRIFIFLVVFALTILIFSQKGDPVWRINSLIPVTTPLPIIDKGNDVSDVSQLSKGSVLSDVSQLSKGNDLSDVSQLSNALNPTGGAPLHVILVWTKFFGAKWEAPISMFAVCPSEYRCTVTYDRSQINKSSAVLFHIRDLDWSDIPKTRKADQYYVYSLWEPPYYTMADISSLGKRDFFNLTMTYRRDSDQFSPYATFRPLVNRSISYEELMSIAVGKSKLAAWFVSNCKTPSGREKFVAEFQKHATVDVYGKCGTLNCPRTYELEKKGGVSPCNRMLTKDYKFYFSLENGLCKDYVTEKFFYTLQVSVVVPIVMERKLVIDSIEDEKIARIVNKSIIAADDFQNVRQLTEYLKYLDQNLTAYVEYLQWRRMYQVDFQNNACELCRVVRNQNHRRIENISKWWIDQASCHSWNP